MPCSSLPRLPALGIDLQWVTQVGDDLDMLVEAFTRALTRSDIVFASGGLGPTQDDLTREAIAGAMGEKMEVQDDLLEHLEEFFRKRGCRDAPPPTSNKLRSSLRPRLFQTAEAPPPGGGFSVSKTV